MSEKNNIGNSRADQNGVQQPAYDLDSAKTQEQVIPNLMLPHKSVLSTSSNESASNGSFAIENEIEKRMAQDGFDIVKGPPMAPAIGSPPRRNWLHMICLVTDTRSQEELNEPAKISKEEQTRMEVEAVRETQFWSFCNGLVGTIALIISGFLWGHYA